MMKYSSYTWHLVRTFDSAFPASCKGQPHLLIPSAQTINQKIAKNPEMRFNLQQILWHCVGVRTQDRGLRQVELEPSPNRGSEKISILKWCRKTPEEKKSLRAAWTHIWIPALREVDLEPSAMKGASRTEAIVSLYWSSQSLHTKEPPNRFSHKSTKANPIRLSLT